MKRRSRRNKQKKQKKAIVVFARTKFRWNAGTRNYAVFSAVIVSAKMSHSGWLYLYLELLWLPPSEGSKRECRALAEPLSRKPLKGDTPHPKGPQLLALQSNARVFRHSVTRVLHAVRRRFAIQVWTEDYSLLRDAPSCRGFFS